MEKLKTNRYRLYRADNMASLALLADNSVDSIVTDPPYGLSKEPDPYEMIKQWYKTGHYDHKGKKGFMGNEWDSFVPQPAFWKEAYRVLKPGGHVLAFFGSRTMDLGSLAIRLAGFEIRDTMMWLYGCFDRETDILTDKGWLNGLQITKSTRVAQWCKDTGEITFVKPQHIINKPYKGTMVNLKNRHTDQLVTPDHDVIAKIRKSHRHAYSYEFEKVKAGDLQNIWYKDIPVAGRYEGSVYVDPDYAYIVGWWLTDAWVHGDKKACMFSQCKTKTLTKLRSALSSADCVFSEYVGKVRNPKHKPEHTFYVTGALADRLLSEFPDRKLTWDLLHWNRSARLSLLKALTDGDGSYKYSKGKMDGSKTFYSIDPDRRSIFTSLCISLGYRAHDDGKCAVYFNTKTNTTQLQYKHKIGYVEYEGRVWCVKVPLGAVVVRRRGSVFISGNSGFPKSLAIDKAIDKTLGAKPKVVGRRKHPTIKNPSKVTKGNSGYHATELANEWDLTEASSDAAQRWKGWGTSLKPSLEPIVLARKPLEGTVAANTLKHGVGGMNINGCRLPIESESDKAAFAYNHDGSNRSTKQHGDKLGMIKGGWKVQKGEKQLPTGRFPANTLLSHHPECLRHRASKKYRCHADCPVSILDAQSGKSKSTGGQGPASAKGGLNGDVYNGGWSGKATASLGGFGDFGGASRFFYCSKSSRSDRNAGCATLPDKEWKDPKIPQPNRNKRPFIPTKNTHPTVKPTDLMRYLCRLVTPKNGILLDPFMGSGSTGRAAMLEGFRFIGMEQSLEYFQIASTRIESTRMSIKPSLFDK